MQKVRKIFDISYYPVERKNASNCTHCGKRLPAGTQIYSKDKPNGRLVVCRECIMRLSDQYQNETYGRLPFPQEEPLYVGLVGHFCPNRETRMIPKTAIFRRKTLMIVAPVYHCEECNRYFIGTPDYEKHCMILSGYNLHHTLTNKPFPGKGTTVSFGKSSSKKEEEYPDPVRWSYMHPYQGGGCSGK